MEILCPDCSITTDKNLAKRIISPGAGFKFNQPGGTRSGAKNEAEVQAAMKDYISGNNKKESD